MIDKRLMINRFLLSVAFIAALANQTSATDIFPQPGANIAINGRVISLANPVTNVNGSVDVQSGTTYTFASTDCGETVLFTSNSAVTATIAASIVPASGTSCNITVIQGGTAKVSVNGTAVSAATLRSASSYTGTSGTQYSGISLSLTTVSAVATAYLFGNGS